MTTIFTLLENNKGTVSSALGKELANEALSGKSEILNEAIELTCYDLKNVTAKNIRAGAAKIVEKVAEQQPEQVAPQLEKLLPGLKASEPQTRWMLIKVFGYCAALNSLTALQALDIAESYVHENAGVCLSGAAAQYLGHVGQLSESQASAAFLILHNFLQRATENEVDWILEAYLKIYDNLDNDAKVRVIQDAESLLDSKKKSTVKRVKNLLRKS